jgi:hypothetical protein
MEPGLFTFTWAAKKSSDGCVTRRYEHICMYVYNEDFNATLICKNVFSYRGMASSSKRTTYVGTNNDAMSKSKMIFFPLSSFPQKLVIKGSNPRRMAQDVK